MKRTQQEEYYRDITFAIIRLKCTEAMTRVEIRDCQQTLEQLKPTMDFAHYGSYYGSANHYRNAAMKENKRLLAIKAKQIRSINVKELEE